MDGDRVENMPSRLGARVTHVLEYDGGLFTREIGPHKNIRIFADTLSRFNGNKPWALTLIPLPEGQDYGEMLAAKVKITEFLQAGGTAEAMTLQIRKPGGQQWGVESVWYVVGHPHDGNSVKPDVAIHLPNSDDMVSQAEVFTADEAAELFFAYYQHGDLPNGYTLRPINGWTSDGENVDLREQAR